MQSLSLLHGAGVCTVYGKRRWVCLMMGCTTAPWLCVERYFLGKEQDLMLKVRNMFFSNVLFYLIYLISIDVFHINPPTGPSRVRFLTSIFDHFVCLLLWQTTLFLSGCMWLQLYFCLSSWTFPSSVYFSKWPTDRTCTLEVNELICNHRRCKVESSCLISLYQSLNPDLFSLKVHILSRVWRCTPPRLRLAQHTSSQHEWHFLVWISSHNSFHLSSCRMSRRVTCSM